MKRSFSRIFFCTFTAAILSVSCTVPKLCARQLDEHNATLNLLWLIADDLSPDLGCYNAKAVSTPNLDALAKSGIRFEQAFATCPVCSPSRSAFVTGIYQTTLGAHHHRTRKMPVLPEGTKSVMQHFQEAGYFVCNKGKTDYNFHSPFKFDGDDWSQRGVNQPFFAQIQLTQPHRVFKRNRDPDRLANIELPPHYPDHPLTRVDWANYLASIEAMDQSVGRILKRLQKEGLENNTVVMFFGDHGRAHVWGKQWLYEGGIRVPLLVRTPGGIADSVNNDLVSLLDIAPTSLALAGLAIPESMQGQNLFDESRPERELIFAARDRSGDAVDRIRCVRTADFKYIRNYRPDLPYAGRSSYKKLRYPVLTLMQVLHSHNELTEAQARFFAPDKPEEELYDLRVDPFELKNLATDANYAADLKRLSVALKEWETSTGDRGRVPEMPDLDMQTLLESKRSFFEKAMKPRGFTADYDPEAYLAWWMEHLDVTAPEPSESGPASNRR